MKNSRLLELFLSLTKSERRALGKFICSPFFNRRQDVINLYQYLYERHPFVQEKYLERAFVFRQVFPNEVFDTKKLDYVMSFLFQHLKTFLTYVEMEADESNRQILLSRALRRRNLGRIFEKEVNQSITTLDNQTHRNIDFHFHRFQLHFEKYAFNNNQHRTSAESFQEWSDELTHYFIANKLLQACTALALKTLSQVEYRQDLLEEVLQHVEQKDYADVPSINLYFHLYKALTETDSQPWFEAFRKLIQQHGQQFPKAELREFYMGAINYCIKQFNAGKKAFLQQAFELYQEGLALEIFVEQGILSRFTYNNIVLAGLLLKEFEWVEAFLHENKHYIEERYRESTFNYNLANLYFRRPDYPKAIQLLQRVEFDDVLHNLNARRMLLRIYFEEKAYDALHSLLTSFKNFIYRHKELGGYHRDAYLNLIRFTTKVLQLKPYDNTALAQLKKEILETESVAEKGWLLGVLD